MELSIVTTLFYSSPYINEFYNRISKSVKKITDDYEIIFVNDGSPDNSLEIAVDLYKKDQKVRVIDLSRNFGHHKAIMTGLRFAKGDKIFLINCDLEEAPENIREFYRKLSENPDFDVIYGIQEVRKGGYFNKIIGEIFYIVLNLLSNLTLNSKMAFSRLMTRQYVKNLLKFRESELFLPGLWDLTGYKHDTITISAYHKGRTSYTLNKKLALIVNAVTSFSDKPLIYIFYIGILISFISGLFGFYFVFRKVILGDVLTGWTSLILSLWFIGGLLILFIGTIGIYLSKVFIETKRRPYTIIKKKYNKTSTEETDNENA